MPEQSERLKHLFVFVFLWRHVQTLLPGAAEAHEHDPAPSSSACDNLPPGLTNAPVPPPKNMVRATTYTIVCMQCICEVKHARGLTNPLPVNPKP